MFSQEKINLFWSYVEIKNPDDCWNWTAGLNDSGYGQFWIGKKIKAHRFSWMLTNNQEIPKDLVIKHSCDNTKCVNPKHLSLGTVAENNKEAIDRQRLVYDDAFKKTMSKARTKYINDNPDKRNVKLTNQQVLEIREKYRSDNANMTELGRLYSVSKMSISKIIRYITYPNLK